MLPAKKVKEVYLCRFKKVGSWIQTSIGNEHNEFTVFLKH